jgi:methylmalonyl-CoA mutase, N-terminal domain
LRLSPEGATPSSPPACRSSSTRTSTSSRSHTETVGSDPEILRISPEVERVQIEELAKRRMARDQATVEATLAALTTAARTDANLVEPMLDAARAEATLGEIYDALRAVWGTYSEPQAF